MINLVKNELIKMLHKKSLYIFLFLIINSMILVISLDSFLQSDIYNNSEENRINYLEDDLLSLNLNNEYERSIYISEKVELEVLKEKQKAGFNTFKASKIEELGYTSISCYIDADINKNTDIYNVCKKDYETILNEINTHDYLWYANNDKKDLENQIKEIENKILKSTSDKEVDSLKKELRELNINLEGINYTIDNKLDPDKEENKELVRILNNYVDRKQEYNAYYGKTKDDFKYQNEYSMYIMAENDYYEAKYRLDNKIPLEYGEDASFFLKDDSYSASLLIILLIAILIGGTISEEFNKGTIKQLFIRPHSRTKILFSKIIAAFIVVLGVIIFRWLAGIIIYGLYYGFDSYNTSVLVYNFSNHSVKEINAVVYTLLRVICCLPQYIIIILVATFFSIITLSTSVSSVFTLGIGFSDIIALIFLEGKYFKGLELLPFKCWNFGDYLFGHIPDLLNSTLTKSIISVLLTIIILLLIQIIVLKKRNIKNQ